MDNKFLSFAVTGVQQLQPYLPGKPVEELERELGISNILKLASNENPLGPSQAAIQSAQKVLSDVNFYPDGSGHKLSKSLADYHQVDQACITLGNGSNDILELIGRAFLSSNTSAVYSEYSFAVYPLVVQAVNAEARVAAAYPENHETMPYGHNLEAIREKIIQSTRVEFIANPNNPTGTWFEVNELYQFLESVSSDVIVVLDEAYFEYMPEEFKPDSQFLLEKFSNVIITRTFSKIYGLAGLRIGYSISHPDVANILNRVRQPFNTNMLAQAAALEAINDKEHVSNSVRLNQAGLKQYADAFKAMDLPFIPSIANFISVNVQRESMPVYNDLLQEGVIVRPVANYNMPNHLRITVGTETQNTRVIQALDKVLKKGV